MKHARALFVPIALALLVAACGGSAGGADSSSLPTSREPGYSSTSVSVSTSQDGTGPEQLVCPVSLEQCESHCEEAQPPTNDPLATLGTDFSHKPVPDDCLGRCRAKANECADKRDVGQLSWDRDPKTGEVRPLPGWNPADDSRVKPVRPDIRE